MTLKHNGQQGPPKQRQQGCPQGALDSLLRPYANPVPPIPLPYGRRR